MHCNSDIANRRRLGSSSSSSQYDYDGCCWYLDSGEGTATNGVLSAPERVPAFFTLWCSRAPEYFRPRQIPVLYQPNSNPSGPHPDRLDACQISPPILPQFHRCIAWLGLTTSTSDHRLLDNAEILLNCLQAASDSYLSLSYYSNAFPCQALQSEANCTHPSSSFTLTTAAPLP